MILKRRRFRIWLQLLLCLQLVCQDLDRPSNSQLQDEFNGYMDKFGSTLQSIQSADGDSPSGSVSDVISRATSAASGDGNTDWLTNALAKATSGERSHETEHALENTVEETGGERSGRPAPPQLPPSDPSQAAAPAAPGASAFVLPFLLRAGLGTAGLLPGQADNVKTVPGKWATYGEEIRGYEEGTKGGDYLKTFQNTKPIPMWWRYNSKLPPPWFQPNPPPTRPHLMRAPVPIPQPPFGTPFHPAWGRGDTDGTSPPPPPVWPYKHPMSLPWGNEGSMQCPCPGNPALICDCLSLEYQVDVPESMPHGAMIDTPKLAVGRIKRMLGKLMQPPMLEMLLGAPEVTKAFTPFVLIYIGSQVLGSVLPREYTANHAADDDDDDDDT